MKLYGIQSLIFTRLRMWRYNLITKEKSKKAYEGKLKNENYWRHEEGSINDDLESFFNDSQEISSLEEEEVRTFFLPKLTKEELKLVEEKNWEHMQTYWDVFKADVDPKEMKKSKSSEKYLHGGCLRKTMVLDLDHTSSKTSIRFFRHIWQRHIDHMIWCRSVQMGLLKYFRAENLASFRYADGLKQLANMGFLNEELNIHLIQKHCQVNLQAVIEELLAYQTSESFSRITISCANSAEEIKSIQVQNPAENSTETVSESPCLEAVSESEFVSETPASKKRKYNL